jgi:hypothetical protein
MLTELFLEQTNLAVLVDRNQTNSLHGSYSAYGLQKQFSSSGLKKHGP